MESKKQALERASEQVEEMMLMSVGVIARDFQPSGQAVLNERMYDDLSYSPF